jgi:hypothetical protein
MSTRMSDPEEPAPVDDEDLIEREADVTDEFDRPIPVEADEADAIEQKLDVPEADEDAYPG